MGKLHTLRRAIERDPKKWIRSRVIPNGAWFWKGQWHPDDSRRYRKFVAKVLKEMGRLGPSDAGPG